MQLLATIPRIILKSGSFWLTLLYVWYSSIRPRYGAGPKSWIHCAPHSFCHPWPFESNHTLPLWPAYILNLKLDHPHMEWITSHTFFYTQTCKYKSRKSAKLFVETKWKCWPWSSTFGLKSVQTMLEICRKQSFAAQTSQHYSKVSPKEQIFANIFYSIYGK